MLNHVQLCLKGQRGREEWGRGTENGERGIFKLGTSKIGNRSRLDGRFNLSPKKKMHVN